VPWETLPKPFREDVARHLEWARVPDPLAEGARVRPLGLQSINLRREHIHSAVHAATAAGIQEEKFTSLATLVEPEIVRVILRHLWHQYGNKLSARTHGIAVTLVAIGSEWVKLPAEKIAELKRLQSKLGTLPPGLTEKNKALLRKFEDPCLLTALVQLPDTLWHRARRGLSTSRWPFIDLQSALAIDLLIHFGLRMQNLSSLRFDAHLHWPQGRRKPALLTFRGYETKNDDPIEREIPTALAERLQVYRNEIAPAVIGERPDPVFVTFKGKPRTQEAIKVAIERTVLRHLGVKITPHQFRHLAAKIELDRNPAAYELVRQLLGHKNLKTTVNNYCGLDTKRAGRAHAELIMKLRESKLDGGRRRRKPRPRED
jgi:integrase